MIKKITIKKLFNLFDHEIDLFESGDLTIVVGQNGLGKTAILKIIHCILNKDLIKLSSIIFNSIIVEFSSGEKWEISKETPNNDNYKLMYELADTNSNLYVEMENHPNLIDEDEKIVVIKRLSNHEKNVENNFVFSKYSMEFRRFKRRLARVLPVYIREIDENEWHDRRNDVIYTLDELMVVFGDQIPAEIRNFEKLPAWYTGEVDKQNVFFIDTQRLLTSASNLNHNKRISETNNLFYSSVDEYSKDLTRIINETLAKATEISAKLDRSYPERLIEQYSNKSNKEENVEAELPLEDSLKKLETNRQILFNTGLLELNNNVNFSIINKSIKQLNDVSLNKLLRIYISDSAVKLEVFNDLANKIQLLLTIINKRFLKKKLSVNKQDGFVFTSTDKNETNIPLHSLSSGEQHILVLYYQLLFKVKPNTLLLLDEPEISLHIA